MSGVRASHDPPLSRSTKILPPKLDDVGPTDADCFGNPLGREFEPLTTHHFLLYRDNTAVPKGGHSGS
ncbi:hypothetical protein K3728_10475 [Rhodobacteraceae bacterium M385]|nr:hypothetical protein K3728_10475 [Rhodobacteraceae bacterium M385]